MPFIFTSGNPPTSEDTTGTWQAIASNADKPKLSDAEGIKKRSETLNKSSIASCLPKK